MNSWNPLDYASQLKNWLTPSASPSYGSTLTSTTAPAEWQRAIAAQPGFSSVGSGSISITDKALGLTPSPGASHDFSPSWWQSATGYKDPTTGEAVNGWGGPALSVGQDIFGAINGMKQFGLMEDQLKESKRQFDLNFGAQKKAFNSQLEDRQRARVASNAGAYQSVGDYMKKYGM